MRKFIYQILKPIMIMAAPMLVISCDNQASETSTALTAKEQAQLELYEKTKLLAAQGHVDAQYDLGEIYHRGKGVSKDYEKALKLFQSAASQNYLPALHGMATLYDNGRGVPESDAAAIEWHLKAAEQGYRESQYNLGQMYSYGHGAPKDDLEAAKWFQKAADQGHGYSKIVLQRWKKSGRGGLGGKENRSHEGE